MFELAMHDSFVAEMNRAPRNVQKAVRRDFDVLNNHPPQPQPPKIKRLIGYRGLWRLRVSDSYRLVYKLESNGSKGTITLIMLGDRKDIYKRLGANDDGTPGIPIVSDDINDLIEREPTAEELLEGLGMEETETEPDPDRDLPYQLDEERLTSWDVPERYHLIFTEASTEGELLGLANQVPSEVLELVLNCIWPPDVNEIVNTPVRIVDDPDAIAGESAGTRDLTSFLLKLDEDQQAFVGRFDTDVPQGPWLLKGGPGSGKSVVALYCIRELIDREAGKLPGQRRQLRILLTTYTNSLINASRHLLKAIGASGGGHRIKIDTVDRLVMDYLPTPMRQLSPINTEDAAEYAAKAIKTVKARDRSFPFTDQDAPYLAEEIDWVVIGQDLRTVDEYINDADRTGRKRGLSEVRRRQVWAFYEEMVSELREAGKCLFAERQQAALDNARPAFDFVFIDEAQDLRPVGVRFATALAEPRSSVFLTADSNQSIYATGMAWSRVASDLNVVGRARILRRNYRTTYEIWDAVRQLAPEAEDVETMEIEPVYHGPPPVFVRHQSMGRLGDRLNGFIFESLREERVGTDSVAILCPTTRVMLSVARQLDPRLNAKTMRSNQLKVDYGGVTITTMHASKGLGFPIVAIVGVDEGVLPWSAPAGTDPTAHEARQHRLLFVAGTRAMRRLMLATDATRPSPFVSAVTDDYWQIEDV